MIKLAEFKKINNPKALAAIIALIVVALLILINCKGLFSKDAKLKTDIAQKTQALAKEKDILAQQGPLKSKANRIDSMIISIQERFSSNVEEILLQLNKFAVESGVTIKTITPSEKKKIAIPDSQDVYMELPVTLKLKCGYNELVAFLDRIEKAKKIIAVTDIRIQPDPQDIWNHDIELLLNIPVAI